MEMGNQSISTNLPDLKKYIFFHQNLVFSSILAASVWVKFVLTAYNEGKINIVVSILIFLGIELCAIVICFAIAFYYKKGKPSVSNIYIFISPEDFKNDKYIVHDFADSFSSYVNSGIDSINVVVPPLHKRYAIANMINCYKASGKSFWNSKFASAFNNRLHGAVYIFGTLRERYSCGKKKYKFEILVLVGYHDFNKELMPTFLEKIKGEIPNNILISEEYEIEEFDKISREFAESAEYLVGWSHLLSGNIFEAFKLHYDIAYNKKQGLNSRKRSADIESVLDLEMRGLSSITNSAIKPKLLECCKKHLELYPTNEAALVCAAKCTIECCTCVDLLPACLLQAESYLMKVRVNSNNRTILHMNTAYIKLLMGKYDEAETAYNNGFKRITNDTCQEIIRYCDDVINSKMKPFEEPTAYYVKALIIDRGLKTLSIALEAYNEVLKYVPREYTYYHEKTRLRIDDLRKKANQRTVKT